MNKKTIHWWADGVAGLLQLLRDAQAEVGQMLLHVVEHVATKLRNLRAEQVGLVVVQNQLPYLSNPDTGQSRERLGSQVLCSVILEATWREDLLERGSQHFRLGVKWITG